VLTAVKLLSIVTVCTAGVVYVCSDETATVSENLSPAHSFDGTDLWGVFSGKVTCVYVHVHVHLRVRVCVCVCVCLLVYSVCMCLCAILCNAVCISACRECRCICTA
jgi:hypothetical protein